MVLLGYTQPMKEKVKKYAGECVADQVEEKGRALETKEMLELTRKLFHDSRLHKIITDHGGNWSEVSNQWAPCNEKNKYESQTKIFASIAGFVKKPDQSAKNLAARAERAKRTAADIEEAGEAAVKRMRLEREETSAAALNKIENIPKGAGQSERDARSKHQIEVREKGKGWVPDGSGSANQHKIERQEKGKGWVPDGSGSARQHQTERLGMALAHRVLQACGQPAPRVPDVPGLAPAALTADQSVVVARARDRLRARLNSSIQAVIAQAAALRLRE